MRRVVRERRDPPHVVMIGGADQTITRTRILTALLERASVSFEILSTASWGSRRHELSGLSTLRSAFTLMMSALRSAVAMLRASRADLIVVGYPGHIDMLAIGPLARLRRQPVVFDIFVSLDDTIVGDRRLRSPASPMARTARLVDRLSCRLSTMVLADTEEHADFYARATGESRCRFQVLPVGALDEIFSPLPDVQVVPRRVLFYGSFIPLHGVDVIIEAATRLRGEDVEFRIIGSGQERPKIERIIRDRALHNVSLCDPVPLESLPREIAAAAVCLGVFGSSDKAARVVPHKVYECIAMGRPVVTGDTPAARNLLADSVLLVPCNDAAALTDRIRVLLSDREFAEQTGRAGLRLYRERYSIPSQSARLERLLRSALTGG